MDEKMKRPAQSANGYVREHLAEFEEQIARGIRVEALLAEMNSKGYNITMNTFRDNLKKARKYWRDNKGTKLSPANVTKQGVPHVQPPGIATPTRLPKATSAEITDPLTKQHGFVYNGADGIDPDEIF